MNIKTKIITALTVAVLLVPGISLAQTTDSGTVVASIDPSTPAAGTVSGGQAGVSFTKIDLIANGGSAIVQLLSVVSKNTNAVGDLSNIKIYEGSTLLGTASGLRPFPSTLEGYVNVSLFSPITLTAGQHVTLTLTADVAASASGVLDLGIDGGGGNYGAMDPDYSIYGNDMTVIAAPNTQTAIIDQSLQNLLNQLLALLKAL